MANAVAVRHALSDRHREYGCAGRGTPDDHAERLAGSAVAPHHVGADLRQRRSRLWIHAQPSLPPDKARCPFVKERRHTFQIIRCAAGLTLKIAFEVELLVETVNLGSIKRLLN
jgi:hypothetical protein